MPLAYNIGIAAYTIAVKIASLFNAKARLWVQGRKDIFAKLKSTLPPKTKKRLWLHVSSLGEFEQGLPVIEKFKRNEWEIVCTFFSPSGYEVRKNHQGVDFVFYLPTDSSSNASKFLNIVQPNTVIFVKYDFWYHYITQTHSRQIPIYLVSALFREKQGFFTKNGWQRKMLFCFTHIFTQNSASVKLLESIGYTAATHTGDTRADRVLANALQPKEFSLIKQFCNNSSVLIAGSSWKEEEELMAKALPAIKLPMKLIIAPHNISAKHIQEIEQRYGNVVRYSQLTAQNATAAQIVVIDNIGMLSSLYQYGHIALVGGAFRKGLHNILEAAVFGLPVIYGVPIDKYPEGKLLAEAGGGFMIKTTEDFIALLNTFLSDEEERIASGQKAKQFIVSNAGAAQKVFTQIEKG